MHAHAVAALRSAVEEYQVAERSLATTFAAAAKAMGERSAGALLLTVYLDRPHVDPESVRTLAAEDLPPSLASIPIAWLFQHLNNRTEVMFTGTTGGNDGIR